MDSIERARAVEIAAYLTAASFPLDEPEGVPKHITLNPDLVLNSLVQNGARAVDCERSFLSLITGQHQYVVAEMTSNQSLSAVNRDSPPLLGRCKIDLEWGVCPHTIRAFLDEENRYEMKGPDVFADKSRYVIRDFRTMEQFKARPYIAGYPHFVSYLEVPLLSPAGFIIGSYCVVDNKERDFTDSTLIAAVRETADAIMDHMDLVRTRNNRVRSERLLNGLRTFVSGDPSGLPRLPASIRSEPSVLEIENEKRGVVREISEDAPDDDVRRKNSRRSSAVAGSRPGSMARTSSKSSVATPLTSPTDEEKSVKVSEASKLTDDQGASHQPNGLNSLFERAADSIRDAMDLDGLVFLDAAGGRGHHSSSLGRLTKILGQSQRAREECSGQITEAILEKLISDYPRGTVFIADEYGPFLRSRFQNDARILGENSKVAREDNGDELGNLFRYFPQARYLIFLPLRHDPRGIWLSAMMGWTNSVTQTLDGNDVNLLLAFGNSIMAQVLQTEIQADRQSQSDFISSISHELRSPLHGIIASQDLMRQSVKTPFMLSMLDMVESCSTTLLDTLSHLLEHAKINSSDPRPFSEDTPPRGPRRNTNVDLSSLIQDVIESMTLGYLSAAVVEESVKEQQNRLSIRENLKAAPVLITYNFAKRDSWYLPIEIGALKRVVMNLFNNATKYTRSGYVEVNLEMVRRPEHSTDDISITVQDTGIGMSPEYLKYHLFTAFRQENDLSPGTGLGLSIVKSIVDSLGGEIEVDSRLHTGTSVRVLVPNSAPPDLSQLQLDETENIETFGRLRGLSLCVASSSHALSHDTSDPFEMGSASEALRRTIDNIARTHLGMVVNFSTEDSVPSADFVLVDAHMETHLSPNRIESLIPRHPLRSPPVIVLSSEYHIQDSSLPGTKLGGSLIFCIVQPLTVKKLARTLLQALETSDQPVPRSEDQTDAARHAYRSPTTIEPGDSRGSPDPLVVAEITWPIQPTEELESMASETPSHALRCLLVDDNAINLRLISAFVKRLGHPFEFATNGLEAVMQFEAASAEARPYDVILMDISMPVMDGYKATAEIRSFEREHGMVPCKIYALTGLGSDKAKDLAVACGMDALLLKPVRLKSVKRLLEPAKERS